MSSSVPIPKKSTSGQNLSGMADVTGMSASPVHHMITSSMQTSIPTFVEDHNDLEYREDQSEMGLKFSEMGISTQNEYTGQSSHVETDAAMVGPPLPTQVQQQVGIVYGTQHHNLRIKPEVKQAWSSPGATATVGFHSQAQQPQIQQQGRKNKTEAIIPEFNEYSGSKLSQPENENMAQTAPKTGAEVEEERKQMLNRMYGVERYNMEHERRGEALIFTFSEFDAETQQKDRKSAEEEGYHFEKLLQVMGFKVTHHVNKSKSEVEAILKTAAKLDHTNEDCFMCFFMSHGFQGRWFPKKHVEERTDIIYARDDYIFLEDLLQPFKDESSPTLARKPKMFFVQACRGGKASEKVPYYQRIQTDASVVSHPEPGSNQPQEHEEEYNEDIEGCAYRRRDWKPMSYQVLGLPCYKDFLVAQSTLPGYFSFRKESGSWFMKQLWIALKEGCERFDIMEILERVNLAVAYSYEANTKQSEDSKTRSLHGKGQMPWIMSMLTKEVYLSPKDAANLKALQFLSW